MDVWEDDFDSEESDDEKSQDRQQPKIFKKKSNKFPPLNQNPALALFVKVTTKEIQTINKEKTVKNLDLEHQKDLKTLKENVEITIKGSDKRWKCCINGQLNVLSHVFENLK